VFVVGYLGDWRPAAKVLFESESLRRDTPPSRSKREEVTARAGIGPEISGPLAARRFAETDGLSTTSAQMIAVHENNKVGTLMARDYKGVDTYDHTKMVAMVAQPIALAENTIGRQPQNGGNGDGFTEDGPMYTLNATGVHGVAIPINTMTCQGRPSDNGRMGLGIGKDGDPCPTLTEAHSHAVAFQQNTRDEVRYINGDGKIAGALMAEPGMKQQNYIMQSYGFEPGIAKREGEPSRFVEEMAPTLRAGMGDNQTAVAIGVDTYNGTELGDVAVTMTAAGGSSTHSGPKVMVDNQVISWDSELNPNVDKMGTLMRGGQGGRMDGVMHNMAVRRLTPIECERLQGFPDSYTDIKPKGKPTPDGPRYKALGNSMAVPVMKWIGERINQYEKGEL
jgi:DNA (cytosine-5)-methyltransferase 1